jgi:hypothetical protein
MATTLREKNGNIAKNEPKIILKLLVHVAKLFHQNRKSRHFGL